MYDHTYIDKMITDSKEADLRADNMYSSAIITDIYSGDKIKVPYMSITSKYKDILAPYVNTAILTEYELTLFKYKPKLMSENFYGTTELWGSLLELNGMISVLEFNRPVLKIYDPRRVMDIINELLILEGKAE